MMDTQFTLIKDYPKYGIDRNGNIYSHFSKKILKTSKNRKGYVMIHLSNVFGARMIAVHRIVAETYLDTWDKNLQVNHKNLNKDDNSVGNLEMLTCKENIRHAVRAGVHVLSIGKKKIKIMVKRGNFEKSYNSLSDAARELGISQGNIGCILRGEGRTQTKGYTFSKI